MHKSSVSPSRNASVQLTPLYLDKFSRGDLCQTNGTNAEHLVTSLDPRLSVQRSEGHDVPVQHDHST